MALSATRAEAASVPKLGCLAGNAEGGGAARRGGSGASGPCGSSSSEDNGGSSVGEDAAEARGRLPPG